MDNLRLIYDYNRLVWMIQRTVTRVTRSSDSGSDPTPDVYTLDWENVTEYDNFYNAILELLDLAVVDGTPGPESVPLHIDSIDFGPVNQASSLVVAIRNGLLGLTV